MSDHDEDRAAIGRLLETVCQSWNAHDLTAHNAAFAEDADFVNVVGMHWRGRQEIADKHAQLHATIFRNTELKAAVSSVRFLTPTVALAHIRWSMTGAEGVPGWNVAEVREGLLSWVLVSEAGQWRIASAHNTDILPLAMPQPKIDAAA